MIVVTGATGFVGRYLVDHLVRAGEQVVALGRSHKYDGFFRELGVRFVPADVASPDAYQALPPDPISAFVHLAAVIPAAVKDTRSDIFVRTNTLGTFYALELCRTRGVKKFLYTTTLYEAIEHTTLPIKESMGRKYSLMGDHAAYVISKIAAAEHVEHYAQEHGMQGVVFRMTGLLGYGRQEGAWVEGVFHPSAFEVFYRRAKAGQPIEIWGEHAARRDSLYVKDAVAAIYAALKSDRARGLYGIGSGEGRTAEEEAKVFATVFGTKERPVPLVYRPEIADKKKSYYFDISRAKQDFGWAPAYSYAQILADYDKEVQTGRFKP